MGREATHTATASEDALKVVTLVDTDAVGVVRTTLRYRRRLRPTDAGLRLVLAARF